MIVKPDTFTIIPSFIHRIFQVFAKKKVFIWPTSKTNFEDKICRYYNKAIT